MYRILTAWVLLAEGVNCRCREDKFGLEELVDLVGHSEIVRHGIRFHVFVRPSLTAISG